MRKPRLLALLFGLSVLLLTYPLWKLQLLPQDPAALVGLAALVLVGISVRDAGSSLARTRVALGWVVSTALLGIALGIGIRAGIELEVVAGLAIAFALGLGGSIWSLATRKRRRPNYFEGYFQN